MKPSLADRWDLVDLSTLRAPGAYSLVGGPFGSDLTSADYQEEPGVPVIRGTNLGGDSGVFVDEGFVFVAERKAAALHRNLAFPGDLVFTQRGTLGQVAIIPLESRFSRYIISQSQMKLTPDPRRVDSRFLFHYFRSPSLLAAIAVRTLATGVPHINLGILKALPVPLPPLPEQQRIAKILDAADALRATRRAALAQLDTLTQAIFLDLFGGHELSGWELTTVGDIADLGAGGIRTGPFGSQLLHSEFTDEGVAVLGIDNAVINEFRWSERRYVSLEKYERLKRYTVHPGDVLITIMGTCGRCAVVPSDIPLAINTKHLCCISLDQSKCLPAFLHAYFLRHPTARSYLERTAKGAIMDGLNMGLIKAMPIPLAPIPLQQTFAHRIAAIDKLKTVHRASLAELDALFASLQHRAFRGEL